MRRGLEPVQRRQVHQHARKLLLRLLRRPHDGSRRVLVSRPRRVLNQQRDLQVSPLFAIVTILFSFNSSFESEQRYFHNSSVVFQNNEILKPLSFLGTENVRTLSARSNACATTDTR